MPFEVYEDEGSGWRWRLKALNGEVVAQSESYTRREDAERGVEDARRAAGAGTLPDPEPSQPDLEIDDGSSI